MSDQSPPKPVPDDTHCEYCGVSYEGSERRHSSADESGPPAGPPAPQRAEQGGPEIPPLTHCEYCGLEYPESPAPG